MGFAVVNITVYVLASLKQNVKGEEVGKRVRQGLRRLRLAKENPNEESKQPEMIKAVVDGKLKMVQKGQKDPYDKIKKENDDKIKGQYDHPAY